MKINQMIKKLEALKNKHGNVEVLFAGPNCDQEPYGVNNIEFNQVTEDDGYPEDYNLPVGLKFVMIKNSYG